MQIIGGNFGQLKNIQSTTNIRREGKTKDKPRGGFSQSKLNILKLILIYPQISSASEPYRIRLRHMSCEAPNG